MKNCYSGLLGLLTFTFLFVTLTIDAQSPQGIKYQAVARDASGEVMSDESITVRLGIYSGSQAATKVYEETQNITTNQYGLFSLTIGEGSTTFGTFSNIDWGNEEHHLKVEVNTGSGFVDMGTNPLVSVPYSLYAEEAGAVSGMSIDQLTDVDVSGISDGQVLKWNGSALVPGADQSGGSYMAGTGIDISGNTISNTAPDQTVTLMGSGATTVSGTYPNFTISSTDDNTTYTAGMGLNLNGTQFNAMNTNALWNANALQGNDVSTMTPADGEVLQWNASSSAWQPSSSSASLWSEDNGDVYYDGGSVGIGTSSPSSALDLQGTFELAEGSEAFDIDVNTDGQLEIRANTSDLSMVLDDESPFAIGLGTYPTDYNIEMAGDSMQFDIVQVDADFKMTSRTFGFVYDPALLPTSAEYGVIGTDDLPLYRVYSSQFYAETASDYLAYSDRRIKENISTLENPLEKIEEINGVSYDIQKSHYNKTSSERNRNDRVNNIGLIAQEVEEVYPELVRTDRDGLKSVGYMGLIPVLVEATKQMNATIESQQNTIEKQEQKIEDLEQRLLKLEQRMDQLEEEQ